MRNVDGHSNDLRNGCTDKGGIGGDDGLQADEARMYTT
eukprot:CAMPEP_0194491456 /NCGR_PEP_ID=MMETSP0253-20130528/10336_1 /TAXON_ID=2966 /ORGANISM="Noctiluca scintillans" /LENGTH=37 /DNA_ID= /DNA_START= /DNA_END= /DNA_ORIENTATION=